jgi:hypothetical protein
MRKMHFWIILRRILRSNLVELYHPCLMETPLAGILESYPLKLHSSNRGSRIWSIRMQSCSQTWKRRRN